MAFRSVTSGISKQRLAAMRPSLHNYGPPATSREHMCKHWRFGVLASLSYSCPPSHGLPRSTCKVLRKTCKVTYPHVRKRGTIAWLKPLSRCNRSKSKRQAAAGNKGTNISQSGSTFDSTDLRQINRSFPNAHISTQLSSKSKRKCTEGVWQDNT